MTLAEGPTLRFAIQIEIEGLRKRAPEDSPKNNSEKARNFTPRAGFSPCRAAVIGIAARLFVQVIRLAFNFSLAVHLPNHKNS
jgi:hypothetical protein